MKILKYGEGTKNQLDRGCKNHEVLQRVMEETRTMKRRKAKRIVHILRRNCLLKEIIKEKTEGAKRRGRRCRQILDNLKETDYTGI